MRYLRVTLLVLAALILPRQLDAHEATLGVLEFREVRPGAFVGRWTMEPSIGAARISTSTPWVRTLPALVMYERSTGPEDVATSTL